MDKPQLTQQQKKKLKIVAVSDIHGQYYTTYHLPQVSGDIFICAGMLTQYQGDFTYYGTDQDFNLFLEFLDQLKNFTHKIVISGNHQIVLDDGLNPQKKKKYFNSFPCKYSKQFIISEIKKRAIYLEHEFVEVAGLKIFGSPYTTQYCGSAFQVKPPQLKVLWERIPQDLDVLITHGPPYGIFDKTAKKQHAGCKHLLDKVNQVKPKIHIFGHIHEGHPNFGQLKYLQQQGTRFYNVARRPEQIYFPQIK